MRRSFANKVQFGISVDIPRAMKAAKGLIRITKQVTDQACQETAREVAKVGAKEAIEIIDKQLKVMVWPPLNRDYLKKKIEEGYDPRMLVRSAFYLDHITWWKVLGSGKGRKAEYRFGVKQVWHPDAKMKLGRLAAIHEYGTRQTPARPFWRPLAYNLRRRKAFLRSTFSNIFERIWKARMAKRFRERKR